MIKRSKTILFFLILFIYNSFAAPAVIHCLSEGQQTKKMDHSADHHSLFLHETASVPIDNLIECSDNQPGHQICYKYNYSENKDYLVRKPAKAKIKISILTHSINYPLVFEYSDLLKSEILKITIWPDLQINSPLLC